MPLFSFVLPAYKGRFLKDAIQSILNQQYQDFELIIVDDQSPDDLLSIVRLFKDQRIQYYKNEVNIGGTNLIRQWNHCISFATGEYLILACDDDLYHPSFCTEMANLIQKYPKVDLLRSRVLQIDENGNSLWEDGYTNEYSSKYQYLHDWLEAKIFTCIGNFVFRRTVLEKLGGFMDFPCGLGSDIATPIALSVNGVASTSDMLFSFRQSSIHLSSDTRRFKEKLEAISLLSEWLMAIDYELPVSKEDKEAYSIKNNNYLHAKCIYDYFNLVINLLPFNKLYYLRYCRLATTKDKFIMVLRWIKRRFFK